MSEESGNKAVSNRAVIKGEGVIIRKGTGERVPFNITSEPIPEDYATGLGIKKSEDQPCQ